jgi:hypothetical protein
VLVAVVTLEDPRANVEDAEEAAARHNNDEVEAEEGAAKAEDPPNAKFSARIGVFLAAARLPKNKRCGTSARPHRAALLWRGRAGSAAALSEALGRAVGAARLLPARVAASDGLLSRGRFARLGPNCCKVVRGQVRCRWTLPSLLPAPPLALFGR